MECRTHPDLVEAAAGQMAVWLRRALGEQPTASLACSGGATPWAVFARLSEESLPWERVHVFQTDERVAPPGHPDRNLTHLEASLLDRVPAVAHPMPVDDADLEAGAAAYAAQLPDRFDVIHLGLGEDGHTASLVPDDPVLRSDLAVDVTGSYQGRRRMTLTLPVLNRAARLLWIVSGPGKAEMLTRLVRGDTTIPAGRVDRDRALVLTDLPSSPASR